MFRAGIPAFKARLPRAARLCLLLLLLCPAAPAGSLEEARKEAGDAKTLVFSTFPSSGMGELFRRILTEAYGRIGYEARVVGLPAERALYESEAGGVDGEAARVSVVEAENTDLVRVPTPIYVNTVVGYAKIRGIDSGGGFGALQPYRIGSVLGYKYIQQQTASMQHVLLPSYGQLFSMLENDRIDVAVSEYLEGLAKMRGRRMEGVRVLAPPLAHRPITITCTAGMRTWCPGSTRCCATWPKPGGCGRFFASLRRNTAGRSTAACS